MTLISRSILGSVAACAFALPAAAQDYCGGQVASGAWIGGNEANSDITSADDYREQLALVLLGNAHVSLFSLSAPTDVRIEAQGRGTGDPVIELLDGSGAVVGSDDDSGGGTSSMAMLSLQPGQYCMRTTSYDSAPLTATVRIGRSDQEALTEGGMNAGVDTTDTTDTTEPTDNTDTTMDPPPLDTAMTDTDACGGAMMLGSGPVDAMLDAGVSATNSINSVPTYAFELSSSASLTLTAENEDADPVLTLTSEAGEYLAENDDYDGLNSRIDMTTPLQAGTYCLQLEALSDGDLPVTVALTGYDPAAAAMALYDQGEVAPPLDGSYPITELGALAGRTVTDAQMSGDTANWYSLEVTQTGLLLIEAIAVSNGDPVIRLFDDVGREIGYNDDYGQGLDSQIAARVFPGTYLLALTDISDSSPRLRLVMERYVPAQ
ncbi:PPC domain-containing protein [Pelagovum pacificum]|uniref:ABC transporter substrate-binding protein n=1 Tax=Pelagovum pacificum TaxID=2588711 RepID=A0A5C5GHW0_9RHOB|nr:PPC domain-containing protein [Pelagovum pacificum]QQA43151.1 ABC transporter substrate-binding protein [Pelagovum pacificum]TNY33707.1 ABC transporter substrate-binding protein [Pelagovum pacificum]